MNPLTEGECQVFGFGSPMFVPETQEKIRWEARVYKDRVLIIMRGAPLEPIILTVTGKDLEVEDSWEWGAG
jgi:hypothetical protein